MDYADFYNLKTLADETSFNHLRNSEGETIKLAQIKMFCFVKGSSVYYYKTSYKDVEWNSAPISILPRRPRASNSVRKTRQCTKSSSTSETEESSEPNCVSAIHLKPAYHSKVQIAENKKNDPRELLHKNIIPKFYEPCYNSIIP